jgi:hypothetical protein
VAFFPCPSTDRLSKPHKFVPKFNYNHFSLHF